MYVDYEFYQNEYEGRVPALDFKHLERQAAAIVDYYTFNRISRPTNNVKFAVCELIDYLAELKATGGKEVASEAVGTHSITYVTSGRESTRLMQKAIVAKHLAHTGLMYRGV